MFSSLFHLIYALLDQEGHRDPRRTGNFAEHFFAFFRLLILQNSVYLVRHLIFFFDPPFRVSAHEDSVVHFEKGQIAHGRT